MLSRMNDRHLEHAEADGNCAFNAFALGLCDPIILNKLQIPSDNHPFVVETAKRLRVQPATWNTLKTYLLDPATSRLEIQHHLAPLLRQIAMNILIHNQEQRARHLAGTSASIQAELDVYFAQLKINPFVPINKSIVGDIFIQHSFIEDKFIELFQSGKTIDAAQAELRKWWQEAGHQQFLVTMAKPAKSAADRHLYAGDLELAPLGAYFGINVVVDSPHRGFSHQLHFANGELPVELAASARDLANRGIIGNHDHNWSDLPTTEVIKRLEAVPQVKEVLAYIANPIKPVQRAQPVPQEWLQPCRDELRARGVIDAQDRFDMFVPDQITARVMELPAMAAVIQARTATYRPAPVVILQNQSASHWNNVRPNPPVPPMPAVKAKPYQAIKGEKLVNDAVNEAFELLQANQPPFTDVEVQHKFEKVFADFTSLLDNFKNKSVDLKFFKQAKKDILSAVVEDIKQAKMAHKK